MSVLGVRAIRRACGCRTVSEAVVRGSRVLYQGTLLPGVMFQSRGLHCTPAAEAVAARQDQKVVVSEGMTVEELARLLNSTPRQVTKVLRSSGERIKGKQRLPLWMSELVTMEMGHTPVDAGSRDVTRQERDPHSLRPRPPVVTVMGHVDHGKTTLLDYLRQTSVASRESGGITQHIGAFSVKLSTGDKLTFLDTPGHAAFTGMRARGASVTNIAVLVVAADDGVMAQTKECVQLLKEAQVSLVVAINKCDKHQVDIPRVQRQLLECGVQLEQFGGDVQAVEISATQGTGVHQLEEALLAQAELCAVKGDPEGMVEGVVLEARMDHGLGPVASVVVQHGTLRCGNVVVAGKGWAKVKRMFNEHREPVDSAPPATPVLIVGWREMPTAGEECLQVESERRARDVLHYRSTVVNRRPGQRAAVMGTEAVRGELVKAEEVRSVNVLVKGDVLGRVEALLGVLQQEQPDKLRLNVISSGVGPVSDGDVELAASTKSIILAYGVSFTKAVAALVKQKRMTILSHDVIYTLCEQLKAHLESLLPWEVEEEVLGEAVVLEVFNLTGPKAAAVGGCRVKSGRLVRNAKYRILRDGVVVHEGPLVGMKQGKDNIDVARKETECGLSFASNPSWQEGDKVVAFTTRKVPPKLNWDFHF